MITKLFKQIVKKTISSLGYRICRDETSRVNGFELSADLPKLIGKKAPLCLDIGANEGQTIRLLTRAFDQPIIHAFEPSGASFTILLKTASSAGVYLHKMALGNEGSFRQMNTYACSDLNSILPLQQKDGSRFADVPHIGTETVPMTTVANFVRENQITAIDLLKSDTQGFDLEVLYGAEPCFRDQLIHHVMVEVNLIELYEGQAAFVDIHSFLSRYDMQLIDFYEKCREGPFLGWATALYKLK